MSLKHNWLTRPTSDWTWLQHSRARTHPRFTVLRQMRRTQAKWDGKWVDCAFKIKAHIAIYGEYDKNYSINILGKHFVLTVDFFLHVNCFFNPRVILQIFDFRRFYFESYNRKCKTSAVVKVTCQCWWEICNLYSNTKHVQKKWFMTARHCSPDTETERAHCRCGAGKTSCLLVPIPTGRTTKPLCET